MATKNSSKVESHPQFDQIVKMFLDGRGPMYVSNRIKPPLDIKMLRLWKRDKLVKTLEKAKEVPIGMVQALQEKGLIKDEADGKQIAEVVAGATAALSGTDKLLARIATNYDAIDEQRNKVLAESRAKGKTAVAAICALVAQDKGLIELDAKLNRLLDAPTTGVQINIITPQSNTVDMRSPVVRIGTK